VWLEERSPEEAHWFPTLEQEGHWDFPLVDLVQGSLANILQAGSLEEMPGSLAEKDSLDSLVEVDSLEEEGSPDSPVEVLHILVEEPGSLVEAHSLVVEVGSLVAEDSLVVVVRQRIEASPARVADTLADRSD